MLQRGKGESLHDAGETDHRICIIHLESSHQHRCKSPEQVQKNAARFVCNDYNSATSTSALVSSLGWDTLEHRRLFNQSVLFYEFHNGLVNCKLPDSVTRCSSRSLTRSHHLAYQRPQSNILTHCYSFFPRTLRVWNSLPCEVVTSPSLDSFRHTALPAIRSLKVPSQLRRLETATTPPSIREIYFLGVSF